MSAHLLRWSDVRGVQRLASAATLGVVDLVEAMHSTILRVPAPLGRSSAGPARGITGLVYRTVRGVTRLVGASLDATLARIGDDAGDERSSPQREALLAALNGVLGDHLAATANPLALPMRLRIDGLPLPAARGDLAKAVPAASGHVLVMLHGLCMNPLQLERKGHDHARALHRDVGCTALHLHYNTGRHISHNGRDFADLMERLLRDWPRPVTEITLLGHSMGGLVARSAMHHAALAGHEWPRRLERVIFLGAPHLGAPLERAGTLADFLIGISPYSAPFARLPMARSAGIRDLGHANLRDDDWKRRERASVQEKLAPLPLPPGLRCYVMAGSRQPGPVAGAARLRGDGWVPVDSALGCHRDPARDLGVPHDRRWIGYGMDHFDLLDRPEAYEVIRQWVVAGRSTPARGPRRRRTSRNATPSGT